jgi:phosphoglycerol transferase MdoB-like AlkP superfamily enzyme
METSQADTALRQKQNRRMAESRLLSQLEDGLEQFKADVIERPFLYLAIAFIAGFASWTFPVRLIFLALTRLVSFLSGPTILLIGILKISELLSGSGGRT